MAHSKSNPLSERTVLKLSSVIYTTAIIVFIQPFKKK